ncbi:hypothetical protein Forpi1262_v017554 [Fusarium oxysporum f. sp. raphani]|uniref:Uncharacterized protein n=1 Tax=Fusarium oxysporum f. sp. raphani TaxID=96318 RepID=A0A8J5U523_FUSOX|nr:hypothetical protein Forpi1262_v017554 [Fusarium oxysporum f. sp. raphani]
MKHDQIPGLLQPLTRKHFVKAPEDHNKLPTDDALLQVEKEVLEKHLSQLKQLFERCNAENLFAVYILHRHFKVSNGFNLVGRIVICDKCHCYWTRTVANHTINSGEVCGRKFIFDKQQGWLPCEFHEGPAPDLSKVDPEFFLEFTNYLVKHDLTSTFGLEYIVPELLIFDMLEITLPNCELLLVEAVFLSLDNLVVVTTRWGWPSDLPAETRLDCLKAPNTGHKEVSVDTQKSNTNFDDVIRSVKNYLYSLSP